MQIEKSLKAALVATGLAVMQQAAAYDPVTTERLLKPEPQNWLHLPRKLEGRGYSSLDRINDVRT